MEGRSNDEGTHKRSKRSLGTVQDSGAPEPHGSCDCCNGRLAGRVTDWLGQIPVSSEAGQDSEVVESAATTPSSQYTPSGSSTNRPYNESDCNYAPIERSVSPPPSCSTCNTHDKESRLTKMPDYREVNLKWNGIHFNAPWETPPESVSAVCDAVLKACDTTEPSADLKTSFQYYISETWDHWTKWDVRTNLARVAYPNCNEIFAGILYCASDHVFPRSCVPGGSVATKNRVAIPQPTSTYAYDRISRPFTLAQLVVGRRMRPPMDSLDPHGRWAFPFLLNEITIQGPAHYQRGGLWAATNRCMGGAAACVGAVNSLNRLLRQYDGAPKVNNAVFSVATDQSYGELYVSWSSESGKRYYTRRIGMYALGREDGLAEFRRHIHGICDWGKGQRWKDIRSALQFIVKKDRKESDAVRTRKKKRKISE
ncbi:hypothetical protein PG984_007525 [Apiospora sp. TS-2023a]